MDERGEPRRAGLDWRRISRGIVWIGLGTLLLLNTTGRLSWSFWLDALFYWPVLLVALGLRLIFERSAVPWAVLVSPALLLGTLAWVATGHGPGPRADWVRLEAPRTAQTRSWTLDAVLVGSRVDLRTGPLGEGLLVEGRAASPRGPGLRVSAGPAARVRLGRHRGAWELSLPWRRERWELTAAPGLPVSVDLGGAASGGTLDLREAPVEHVRIEGAVNDFRLLLGPPRHETTIRLEGAFNQLALTVPEGVPVEIRKDGMLNVHRRRAREGSSGPGYRVRVAGAFNRLKVDSRP